MVDLRGKHPSFVLYISLINMNLQAYKAERIPVPCSRCTTPITIRRDRIHQTHRKDRSLLCAVCISSDRSKRAKKQRGEKNPNWKGGKTSEIQKFYNSPEWKELRTKVFIRDNYTCRDCPQRGGQLEANHIKARWNNLELALEITNIETLCKKCHDKKKWQAYT